MEVCSAGVKSVRAARRGVVVVVGVGGSENEDNVKIINNSKKKPESSLARRRPFRLPTLDRAVFARGPPSDLSVRARTYFYSVSAFLSVSRRVPVAKSPSNSERPTERL